MKKMIIVGIITILFIGCSVQPENKHINSSSERKVEAGEIESNVNNDFNKKIRKLATLTKSIKKPLTRNNSKEVVIDKNTDLMWQDNKSIPDNKTWNEAKSHCNNLQFANFNDWRLPNIDELLSITDDTRYNPAINKSFKNYHRRSHYANFWSSSSDTFFSEEAWSANFQYGGDRRDQKSSSYHARCVRDSHFDLFYLK